MLMQLPRVIYYGAACKQNYRIMLCFVISWWCRVVIVREKKKKKEALNKAVCHMRFAGNNWKE